MVDETPIWKDQLTAKECDELDHAHAAKLHASEVYRLIQRRLKSRAESRLKRSKKEKAMLSAFKNLQTRDQE